MAALWDEARKTWDQVALAVDRHRDWILPSLRPKRLWLRRANVPIAVTGLPGTGKSVLRDGLMGRAGGLGYNTQPSADWERHRVMFRGGSVAARAGLLVVPGQLSNKRDRALSWAVEGRNAPVGLIHVVCWGYHRLWREKGDKALQEVNPAPTREGNEELRDELLQQEIEDFRSICERLKAPSVQQRLRWLIIAVAKCDLFWSELDRVRDYYIPGGPSGPSDFHRILEGLTAGDRSVPPRIIAVPFSGHPQAHQYAEGLYRTPSQLDTVQATALRNGFYEVLRGLL